MALTFVGPKALQTKGQRWCTIWRKACGEKLLFAMWKALPLSTLVGWGGVGLWTARRVNTARTGKVSFVTRTHGIPAGRYAGKMERKGGRSRDSLFGAEAALCPLCHVKLRWCEARVRVYMWFII